MRKSAGKAGAEIAYKMAASVLYALYVGVVCVVVYLASRSTIMSVMVAGTVGAIMAVAGVYAWYRMMCEGLL